MSWNDQATHARPLAGRRVLVVEDEPLIALELASLLADSGAEVVGPGRTLAESVRLARHERLSAALLDVRLGHDGAMPVARALAARGVPFAFYTGQADADAIRRQWPAAPVITKPTPSSRVLSLVERLCEAERPADSDRGEARA